MCVCGVTVCACIIYNICVQLGDTLDICSLFKDKFIQISCGNHCEGLQSPHHYEGLQSPLLLEKKNSQKNVQSSAFSLRNSYAIPIVMIGAAPCPAKRNTSPICYCIWLVNFNSAAIGISLAKSHHQLVYMILVATTYYFKFAITIL